MPSQREARAATAASDRARAVTSHDVARLAGVSQATVSRVLTGNTNVTPALRQRVLQALRETGYQRNVLASAMKTGRTRTVGVVVSDVHNPFYPTLLAAIGRELADRDHRMVLWETGSLAEDHAATALREGLVDGALLTTAMPGSALLDAATSTGRPVVLVNRTVEHAPWDQVSSDNVAGAMAATRYLLDAGRSRVAMIGGPPAASTARERERGFRHALEERGATGAVQPGDFTYGTAYAQALALLDGDDPPTAIFGVNDLAGFAALNAARRLGATVPDDLWIVGFDDTPMAAWESLDLTSVRQPIGAMATRAVELLVRRMAEPDEPAQHVRFSCALVVRGSTRHEPQH